MSSSLNSVVSLRLQKCSEGEIKKGIYSKVNRILCMPIFSHHLEQEFMNSIELKDIPDNLNSYKLVKLVTEFQN